MSLDFCLPQNVFMVHVITQKDCAGCTIYFKVHYQPLVRAAILAEYFHYKNMQECMSGLDKHEGKQKPALTLVWPV